MAQQGAQRHLRARSVFKIITLSMALEVGVVNKGSGFYCGGQRGGARPHQSAKC